MSAKGRYRVPKSSGTPVETGGAAPAIHRQAWEAEPTMAVYGASDLLAIFKHLFYAGMGGRGGGPGWDRCSW